MSDATAYKRGQIVRINLEPTQGGEQQGLARPCVVLSITALNSRLRTLAVVPLSSSAKPLPPMVVAVPSAGEQSVALCHQVRTVDKSRLIRELGELTAADLAGVEAGVRAMLGL